jgi:DNA-binding IclR family transcriptional regulator
MTGVAAAERAISIMNAFRPNDGPLTLHEVASRTGLYKSTILRLMASLIRHGCIQQLDDGRYALGFLVFHWGSVYQASLRLEHHVQPILRRLGDETGEDASFFKREGDTRVCLFHADSPNALRIHLRVGDILPLDSGAGGKVLLAFDPSRRKTPPAAIIATFGHREPDIAALGAPVFGLNGSLVGALTLSGPVMRFTDDALPGMSKALLNAAVELTRRLGGDAERLARMRSVSTLANGAPARAKRGASRTAKA